MKRLLLAAVVCSTSTYPPVQAYQDQEEFVKTVVLSVAGTCAGLASIDYVASKFPSRQYQAAQKAYFVLDERIISLLEDFDSSKDDIAEFTAELCPCSPYPLVFIFNLLGSVREDAKGAIKHVDNALWWSKDELIVRGCNRLRNNLEKRIAIYEKISVLARSNVAWAQQYALYMQKCQNDQLRDLTLQVALNGLNHCCR